MVLECKLKVAKLWQHNHNMSKIIMLLLDQVEDQEAHQPIKDHQAQVWTINNNSHLLRNIKVMVDK
jgi:ubiquitin-protein ligase